MKVGILTGGGDCPGLNAVIRAVVRKIVNQGGSCLGLLEGWLGLLEKKTRPIDVNETDELIARGGTILGSSRTNPYKQPEHVERVVANFGELGLDALVAIGGDDTLGVASKLYSQENLPTVGVPKTIDNDLSSTDFTFGFDTAINIVVEAVDRIRTTAEAHRRVMVVETMGRDAGWIACLSGMAVGADYVLVPELPINFEHLCSVLTKRKDAGKLYSIVIVSEGARLPESGIVASESDMDDFGHVKLGGIGEVLADMIEQKTGINTRQVTLGYIQRGGPPSAGDRVLATRFGLKAAELALNKQFGMMAALKGNDIIAVPLEDGVNETKKLNLKYYDEVSEWFPSAGVPPLDGSNVPTRTA